MTIMYQLLSKLSLDGIPTVLDHEYTVSTAEPEDHSTRPSDGVINVVRLSQPHYGLDPAANINHTLVLREIWSCLQQSLQATLPPSSALSLQPEVRLVSVDGQHPDSPSLESLSERISPN